MKKFISAVTSICMAATMLAAAVPASVSALDASKGLSVNVLGGDTGVGRGASSITLTEDDFAKGDATISCGLFLDSATVNEICTLQAFVGPTDACADTSAVTVTPWTTSLLEDYYTEEQTFTAADGTEFSTLALPFFTGSVTRRGVYTTNASNLLVLTQDAGVLYGLPTIAVSWNSVNNDSPYLGTNSYDYPVLYFDVTISADAVDGDYVIDLLDFDTNPDENVTSPSLTMRSTELNYEYYTEAADMGEGIITTDSLTITVNKGGQTPTTTTTTAVDTPATTTTTTTKAPTTTPDPSGDHDVVLSYDYDAFNEEAGLDYYQVSAGDVLFADLMIDTELGFSGCHFDFKLDSPLTFDYITNKSDAFGCAVLPNYGDTLVNRTDSVSGIENCDAIVDGGLVKNVDGSPALNVPDTTKAFLSMDIVIPEDCPDGIYYIYAPYTYFQDNLGNDAAHQVTDVVYIPAEIHVGDVGDVTTTTTTAAPTTTTTVTTTTTKAPATTTTPGTTTTAQPGTRLLGDANCDGQVNIADVVVLNRQLAGTMNLEDQGKINAEVSTPVNDVDSVDLTSEDSTYIIQSIIHLWTLTDNGPVATEYNK